MARFSIPRIAHCHGGSVTVPDMTENCPVFQGGGSYNAGWSIISHFDLIEMNGR